MMTLYDLAWFIWWASMAAGFFIILPSLFRLTLFAISKINERLDKGGFQE